MKKYLISLLLMILLYSGNAQPEWHWYNPRPDGKGLRGICVLDSTHAWAVGEKGRILFYDGLGWNPQEANTDQYLLSVSFFDTETGYAVGDSGTILKYQDGDWEDISVPSGYLNKVLMTRATDGWITGDTMLRLVNGI